MEKTRYIKIVSIIALVVALVGMSLGFAAFSATLNISSSAYVNPNSDDFKITVSGSYEDSSLNKLTPEVVGNAKGSEAIIVNLGNKVSTSVNVEFTAPGESVSYDFYVHNIGKYDAYFNGISFKAVDGTSLKKVCTIPEDGDASIQLVNQACEDITFSIIFNDYTITDDTTFTDFSAPSGASGKGQIVISYPAGSARVDGDFSVVFGDVEAIYSTVN